MSEIQQPNENRIYCQQPSDKYMEMLDLLDEDPRFVAGFKNMQRAASGGYWRPDYESRLSPITRYKTAEGLNQTPLDRLLATEFFK